MRINGMSKTYHHGLLMLASRMTAAIRNSRIVAVTEPAIRTTRPATAEPIAKMYQYLPSTHSLASFRALYDVLVWRNGNTRFRKTSFSPACFSSHLGNWRVDVVWQSHPTTVGSQAFRSAEYLPKYCASKTAGNYGNHSGDRPFSRA